MTGLSAARMAAARSSGSSALISIRGRARQVAPSGPRGTYQISQPGNRRSSSRRRSPCPTPSHLHSKQDGHLPAVVYLPPRTTWPSPQASAHAPPARWPCRVTRPPVALDRCRSASLPAWCQIERRRAGSVTIRPGRLCPYCVTSTPLWEGERQAPCERSSAGPGPGLTPAAAPADPRRACTPGKGRGGRIPKIPSDRLQRPRADRPAMDNAWPWQD